jgi:hypothetical protein
MINLSYNELTIEQGSTSGWYDLTFIDHANGACYAINIGYISSNRLNIFSRSNVRSIEGFINDELIDTQEFYNSIKKYENLRSL